MARIELNDDDVEAAAESFDNLSRSADRTSGVLDTVKRGASGLNDRMDRVGGSMVKFRGALNTTSPKAAELAGFVDEGADAMEGLGRALGLSTVALGALAVPLAAMGAALYYAKTQLEGAEAASAKAAATAARYQAAAAPLSATLDDLATQQRILSGETTAEQVAAEEQISTFDDQSGAMRSLLVERMALLDATRKGADGTRADDLAWISAGKALETFDDRASRARETMELLAEKEELERKARDAATRATKARSEAERRLAEDLRRQTSALKESQAAMDEDSRLNGEAQDAAAQLAAATRNAVDSRVSDVERLQQAYSDEWDAQEAIYQKGVRAAGGNNAELKRLNEEYSAYRVARNTQVLAEIAEAEEAATQAAFESSRDRTQAAASGLGQVAGIASALSDLWEEEGAQQSAAAKSAAKTAVLINAAVAIMQGFAQLGPVGGALATVAIGLETTNALKQIEQAHQGRVFGDAPDEIRILRQEVGGVLNSQAVRAYPGAAQAMNSGTFGGGSTTVELRVGDAVQKAVVHQQLNGNTELARRMRTVSSTRAPGMTGRGAVA